MTSCTTSALGGTLRACQPHDVAIRSPRPTKSRALDAAALHWPGEARSRLIIRAITAGGDAFAELSTRRQAAIASIAGRYPDENGAGYLDELRKDWPA